MIFRKIDEGATVFSGYAFKSSDLKAETGIPVIKIGNLQNRLVDYSETQFISEENITEKMNRFYLTERDVLIAMTGQGSVGRVCMLKKKKVSDRLLLNQRVGKFICDEKVLNNDYLYFILATDYYQKVLFNAGAGSGQPNLSPKTILDVEIPFPDIEIQNKVVSMIKPFDEKVGVNSKIIDRMDSLLVSLFEEIFINAKYEANGTFSDLIESTRGGDWGKEREEGNYTKKVYCIRGADIPEVSIGNKGKMPLRYILPKNYEAKKLCDGDLIVEISGGSPTQSTGRIAAVTEYLLKRYDNEMICTNFCRALKPKPNYSMYIYYYWRYLYEKRVFFGYENGTTGIKNLDLNGFLNSEPIFIPARELVQNFERQARLIMKQIFIYGLENEKLSAQRDALLDHMIETEFKEV